MCVCLWLLQSTYCSAVVRHCETIKRTARVVNLDPAAENFDYPVELGERLKSFHMVLSWVTYALHIHSVRIHMVLIVLIWAPAVEYPDATAIVPY